MKRAVAVPEARKGGGGAPRPKPAVKPLKPTSSAPTTSPAKKI